MMIKKSKQRRGMGGLRGSITCDKSEVTTELIFVFLQTDIPQNDILVLVVDL